MDKEEFLEKAGCKTINDDDYQIIEFVYTWHPSIDAVKGKTQVSILYVNFGMRIFKDMYATAEKAKNLEEQLQALRAQERKLKNEYEELRF